MEQTSSSAAIRRAEEIGEDVWEHFVIPFFFEKLDFYHSTLSKVIVGGRGYGKTMLLRYLTHTSSLSRKRKDIPSNIVDHVGLYWRTDMQFSSGMTGRGLSPETWKDAFEHFLAITVGLELLKSLESLALSNWPNFNEGDLNELNFSEASDYDTKLGNSYKSLRAALDVKEREFELWVRNVRKVPEPIFLPGTKFIDSLVRTLRTTCLPLKTICFFVYIDEYENLLPEQQRVINTWIKFSKRPLIINLAMKRNAMTTKETVNSEYISGEHDYTIIDLDHELYKDHDGATTTLFETFAGEIILSDFYKRGLLSTREFDFDSLRDPIKLSERRSESHQKKIKALVAEIFPALSHREIAELTLADRALRNRLKERISTALNTRQSILNPERFILDNAPMESIIAPALLWRRKLTPEGILSEIEAAASPNVRKSKFDSPTEWRSNNFVACLLQLYRPNDKACPLYSGFSVFIELAKGNLRHLLGLCNQAILIHSSESEKGDAVSSRVQTNAAKHVSGIYLSEVQSFGTYGPRLYSFAHRLGGLFVLAHESSTLSENEQNHFAITRGASTFTMEDHIFLREAEKYSVLLITSSTKEKTNTTSEQHEYQLNPIYAPYFNISYRKKRRLEISIDEFVTLSRGSEDSLKVVLDQYKKKFKMLSDVEELPLLKEL